MSILEITHEKQMKEFEAITEKYGKLINVNEFEAWKFDCLWAEVVYS